ncbi:hypothetical protein Hokovirus_3_112 [Hokovirus HKV1]|uniref:Uncharacterized protein n=1 Tax=Hokovirus HKV1 TaxID=1977638 RepID=A0A1V0SGJ1_9VIRU|nr:hypothetical protein Hokovirus_3_112 [Hokovirus HKV1]
MSITNDPEIFNQKFVCLSIVLPRPGDEDKISAIKIRGVYETEEEAKKRALELQKIDPYFHIFIGDVGRWLPLDPAPDRAKNQVYYEKELNDLINGEVEQVNEIKLLEEKRRNDLVLAAQKEKAELEKKRKEGQVTELFENVDPITSSIETSDKREKKILKADELLEQFEKIEKEEQEEKKKLENLEQSIKNKEVKLNEFEANLEKIKQLQKKMQKKN